MIYPDVRMTKEQERKKVRRDWLKAVGYSMLGAAMIAAAVVLTGRLGLR